MAVKSKLELFRNISNILAVQANEDALKEVLEMVRGFFLADGSAILGMTENTQLQGDYQYIIGSEGINSVYVRLINERKELFQTQKVEIFRQVPLGAAAMIVVAPLKYQDKKRGILILGWREVKQLKPNDEELFETIGNLIGVALYQNELISTLRLREKELQYVCQGLLTVKEEEGKRLSRELHDEIGQNLTSLLLYIKLLQREELSESVQCKLDALRVLVSQTLTDAHRISMNLRPAALDELGLLASLRWYVDEYRKKQPGLQVTFDAPAKLQPMTKERELAIYRAVIEALTNVSRHANASQVEVRIQAQGERLFFRIADNGIGMPAEEGRCGLGLLGMRERLRAVGANLRIESNPGEGTRIEITIA